MPLNIFCRYFQLTVVILTYSVAESYAVNRALSELTEGKLFRVYLAIERYCGKISYRGIYV